MKPSNLNLLFFIRKISLSFLPIAGVLLVFSSCRSLFDRSKKEGFIEYGITYLSDSAKDNLLSSMMPSKMNVRFKNNMTAAELKIGMGIMSTVFISNPDDRTLTTLLQIVDKKYALVMDSAQIGTQLRKAPGLQVKLTGDSKMIAGFRCRKAVVTDDTGNSYDVYYTKEIKVKNPNWSTPLKEIDGVMLEYQIKQKNIVMKLTALKVEDEDIDKNTFSIPPDFKVVSRADMPEIFSQFFE